MPLTPRICVTLLLLLTSASSARAAESKPRPIRQHDRVLCITADCVLKSPDSNREYEAPFGTILKVSKIDEGRCLVYNHFMDGWIDLNRLASLSDEQLPTIIKASSLSPAEKEYALGNYFSLRNPSQAKTHFEKSVALDRNLDHAYVDLAHLHATMGDDAAVEASLTELKRFPNREEVVLGYALQSNPTEAIFRRCNEVMKTSSFLKGEMANYLYSQNDARLLASANEFAFESLLAQKFNPWRSHVLAMIYIGMRQGLLDDENMSRKAREMAIAQWVAAISADHYFWAGYELLALTHIDMGKKGEAIRLAQAALRMNPRSHTAARLIARFSDAAAAGESFKDATGAEIHPVEILPMAEIERGLKQIAHFDLPLLPGNRLEEELRLHGYMSAPSGREVDDEGQTALHLLVKEGNGLCLNYLSKVFILDWNRRDAMGKASLHRAIESNDLPMVATLVRCGADVSFKTASGDSAIAMACKVDNPTLVACLVRSEKVLKQDLQRLRGHCGVSRNATVADLRRATYDQVVARLNNLVTNELTHLTQGYAVSKRQLQADQNQQEQLEDFIPLSNAPILVPGYISDIGKYNPARANMMMNRRIQQEVTEHLELYSRNKEAAQDQVRQGETQVTSLRRQATELADEIIAVAYYSFSPDEFTPFAKSTGARIQGLLDKETIGWKMPFTPVSP